MNPSTYSWQRVSYSIAFSFIAVLVLFYIQPPDMFDENGNPRGFGLEEDQTLFTAGTAISLVAGCTLFIFTWIDMVFGP